MKSKRITFPEIITELDRKISHLESEIRIFEKSIQDFQIKDFVKNIEYLGLKFSIYEQSFLFKNAKDFLTEKFKISEKEGFKMLRSLVQTHLEIALNTVRSSSDLSKGVESEKRAASKEVYIFLKGLK